MPMSSSAISSFDWLRNDVLYDNMNLRHCLLSDTESETYMAQYTISYDVINKRKKLPNLTLLQTGQPSHNLNKL